MFRFETAGESHGECLVATLTGLPAGLPVSFDFINRELERSGAGWRVREKRGRRSIELASKAS